MVKDKFLRGALILTAAGLMVKVIGAFNRILLSRLLGGEGIGLYQMAYPVYLLMVSVSSAGIPIAISIVVAEKIAKNDYGGAARIFRVSLVLMVVTGIFFAPAEILPYTSPEQDRFLHNISYFSAFFRQGKNRKIRFS